jgi:hypothetical protein
MSFLGVVCQSCLLLFRLGEKAATGFSTILLVQPPTSLLHFFISAQNTLKQLLFCNFETSLAKNFILKILHLNST